MTWKKDALSFPWMSILLVAFPSFSFLPRVLEKLDQGRGRGIAGGAILARRPWSPKLLSLIVKLPRVLQCQKFLTQPLFRQVLPKVESLHLTLWQLSGREVRRRDFFKESSGFFRRVSPVLNT